VNCLEVQSSRLNPASIMAFGSPLQFALHMRSWPMAGVQLIGARIKSECVFVHRTYRPKLTGGERPQCPIDCNRVARPSRSSPGDIGAGSAGRSPIRTACYEMDQGIMRNRASSQLRQKAEEVQTPFSPTPSACRRRPNTVLKLADFALKV
jgi:hypothetical protein